MHWALGLAGFFLGGAAGSLAVYNRYRDQIVDLRVALCDCIQALEFEGGDALARDAKNARALRRARKVLDGQTKKKALDESVRARRQQTQA